VRRSKWKEMKMSKPAIGFIGLGLMGSAMCNRLIDQGYTLNVLANRSRANVEALRARGANEVASAKALAEASDIIMLCMDTSASVEGRIHGADGVMAGASKGATIIDFGTSLPSSTRAIGAEVAAIGVGYLDAPLGRTPAHALDGKLNIMCAGDETVFRGVEPVLRDLGENVFHLGALGSGHTIKLINNFFGMTLANAMCEAFAMADQTGVDRQALYDVMSAGPLRSGMMDFVKGYAIDGTPDRLAFSIRNARKDVGYYARMAEDAGAESLMSVPARHALGLAVAQGHGDLMVSQMVDVFAAMMGGQGAKTPSD
jgi:2-hydroxy-3-oxopropionate reductase